MLRFFDRLLVSGIYSADEISVSKGRIHVQYCQTTMKHWHTNPTSLDLNKRIRRSLRESAVKGRWFLQRATHFVILHGWLSSKPKSHAPALMKSGSSRKASLSVRYNWMALHYPHHNLHHHHHHWSHHNCTSRSSSRRLIREAGTGAILTSRILENIVTHPKTSLTNPKSFCVLSYIKRLFRLQLKYQC